MSKGVLWDFRFFPNSHGKFHCKGSMDLALEGRNEEDPLCVGNLLEGPTCWLGAEPHFQLQTHKESPSFLPSSTKSMDPWQWNCMCPREQKSEIPKTLLDMNKRNPFLDITTRSKERKKQRPSLALNKTYSPPRLKNSKKKEKEFHPP